MDAAIEISLSVFAIYAYALALWPILRVKHRAAQAASVCLATLILSSPLLVSSGRIAWRALVAFLCTELMCKMIDYARQVNCRGGTERRFIDYVRFLIPFPILLIVFGQRDQRLHGYNSVLPDALRTCGGAAVFASGFVFLHLTAQCPAVRSSFLLDHFVKIVIFAIAIEGLSQGAHGLERLAKFETVPLINGAFLSPTVGSFWCRYNTRMHDWMKRNVFLPFGGRHAPVRGVLATFFVSGVIHELMFGIATSRINGYQFAFFMLQAPAVLVSRPLMRFGTRRGALAKMAVCAAGVAWLFVTSVLFFHGVNRVFPFFYASEPWLP